VVIVAPIEHRRVQVHPRLKRDGLKHMSDQSGGHPPNGGIAEIGLDHGIRPPAEVDHHARQGLVHGHVGRAHTRDAVAVAQRLVERATQANRHVLDGMVRVDVQIAGRFHG